MPQHKSAAKRVRQNSKRRARNRISKTRIKNTVKAVRAAIEEKDTAKAMEVWHSIPDTVMAYLDRLTAKGIIHQNKAANYKSKLERHVNALG